MKRSALEPVKSELSQAAASPGCSLKSAIGAQRILDMSRRAVTPESADYIILGGIPGAISRIAPIAQEMPRTMVGELAVYENAILLRRPKRRSNTLPGIRSGGNPQRAAQRFP